MLEKIEKTIEKILKIVEKCPANLQEKCFEILLNAEIASLGKNQKEGPEKNEKKDPVSDENKLEGQGKENNKESSDIKMSDVHVKAKKIVESIGLELLNNTFYKEGAEFKPLYDDLGSTKVAESQIRVALLEALKSGLANGEFMFDSEMVREQCDAYKCYDKANFAAHFKNNSNLFTDKYEKGAKIKLSSDGKQKLIDIIKELK